MSTGAGAFSFAMRPASQEMPPDTSQGGASTSAGVVPWQVLSGDPAADDDLR